MVNNTVYHFVGSNLWVKMFLKKREHQEKGALKWRIEAPLYNCGFQENSTQSLSTFLLFFGNRKNSKSSVFFHSLIMEFL